MIDPTVIVTAWGCVILGPICIAVLIGVLFTHDGLKASPYIRFGCSLMASGLLAQVYISGMFLLIGAAAYVELPAAWYLKDLGMYAFAGGLIMDKGAWWRNAGTA